MFRRDIATRQRTVITFNSVVGFYKSPAVTEGDFAGVRYLASSVFVPTNTQNGLPA